MKDKRKPLIVAYDVSKHKTRRKVFKILKEWKLDGQKSLAECRLKFREAEELFLQLTRPLDPKTDLMLLAFLDPHRKALCRGTGKCKLNERLKLVI